MPDTANTDLKKRSEISPDLTEQVLTALGLEDEVANDLSGLTTLYRAWCERVPFDNIRKMIALKNGGEMPGLDAADFFENWLENGTSATCWPSSNALFALVSSVGFNARRVAGAMFDLPDINHGTVKVRLDGADWLVDSSMLTLDPLPLHGKIHIQERPGIEVEPIGDSYLIWCDFPPMPEYIPCGLRLDGVDDEFYLERYETFSRDFSPFNERLYFRRGGAAGTKALLGNTLFERDTNGELVVREFGRDELFDYLATECGVSERLLSQWVNAGGLDASMAPHAGGGPEVQGTRPSRRMNIS